MTSQSYTTKDAGQVEAQTVLVLRTCAHDMTSHKGFKWPESGEVACPDWSPVPKCGNGLHGWLWGSGNWELKSKDQRCKWLVVEVDAASIVELGGKVKFPRGTVVACEDKWWDAMAVIRRRLIRGSAELMVSATTILWHDGTQLRMSVAYVGENGIKPGTWYVVRDGKIVEAEGNAV